MGRLMREKSCLEMSRVDLDWNAIGHQRLSFNARETSLFAGNNRAGLGLERRFFFVILESQISQRKLEQTQRPSSQSFLAA